MNIFEQIKEKLIMKLNYSSGYPNCSEYDYAYECAMSDARKQAIEIVEQIEKEHNSGWIPCSERLPDEKGDYLVTCNNGKVYIWWWYVVADDLKFWKHEVTGLNPIAWRPLPEPYKESEDK